VRWAKMRWAGGLVPDVGTDGRGRDSGTGGAVVQPGLLAVTPHLQAKGLNKEAGQQQWLVHHQSCGGADTCWHTVASCYLGVPRQLLCKGSVEWQVLQGMQLPLRRWLGGLLSHGHRTGEHAVLDTPPGAGQPGGERWK
jgi:hypothetical protein